jgi:hypothetical protein
VFARLPSTVTIEFKDVAAPKNVVGPLSGFCTYDCATSHYMKTQNADKESINQTGITPRVP